MRQPVHPRVCGEQQSGRDLLMNGNGSSPRVRGTVFRPTTDHGFTRFIPACAGNRNVQRVVDLFSSVHPRVCGEQTGSVATTIINVGSSPRVRGTGFHDVVSFLNHRFIPACAGNSTDLSLRGLNPPVHPRVCGEQYAESDVDQVLFGSSPRVRGTEPPGRMLHCLRRFIPACAGNRPRATPHATSMTVHPRVCGEQASAIVQTVLRYGSSPRVRGTEPSSRHILFRHRFIPACAGNSFGYQCWQLQNAVHPRVCGEQGQRSNLLSFQTGSSPRVRGTD